MFTPRAEPSPANISECPTWLRVPITDSGRGLVALRRYPDSREAITPPSRDYDPH
jgi:hypothetical protein